MMNGYHIDDDEETPTHREPINEDTRLLAPNGDAMPRVYPRIPRDKWKFVYVIFYFLGMTSLMPWNFFITCDSYWMYKFRNTSTVGPVHPKDRSELQVMFASYLAMASMIPNAIFSIVNSVLVHKIHVHVRGLFSLVVVTFIFAITTAFVRVDTDQWQMGFLALTLILVVVLNTFGSVFMGVVCGLAGRLPIKYMSAVSSGQALGGLLPSIVRIVSLAVGTSPEHAALVYFIIADVTVFAALILYYRLTKTRFLKFHMRKESIMGSTSCDWENWEDLPEDPPPISLNFFSVIRKIKAYVLTLVAIYLVTLGLFPAVTVNISSVHYNQKYPLNSDFFVPVVCFFIYNFGDYVGRITASNLECPGPRKRRWTLIASLLRVVFIPLFILSNVQPRSHLPVLIDSDVCYIVFMAMFSFSNGYLTSICFMHGPTLVNSEEEEAAGAILSTSISLGTVLGSISSTGLIRIP